VIRLGASPAGEAATVATARVALPPKRSPRLTGSILVAIADGKRALAARSGYHGFDRDGFGGREGVYRVRDMGSDGWQESVSVTLSPSHDCRLGELVHDVVDRLEAKLGRSLEWSAWVHRDTDNPHAHLVIRYDGGRQREQLHREIEPAAGDAYRQVRELQREYAREQERLAKEREQERAR
jgi:hypothetical protein